MTCKEIGSLSIKNFVQETVTLNELCQELKSNLTIETGQQESTWFGH